MDSELLNSNQVFTGRNTRRDIERVRLSQIPRRASTTEFWALVVDLEPYLAGAVEVCSGRRCFGHVYGNWSLVVDSGIGGESEGGAGFDCYGGCVGARGTTNIADQIFGCQVCDGRVVVCVPADVGVRGILDTICSEGLEDIWRCELVIWTRVVWSILQCAET